MQVTIEASQTLQTVPSGMHIGPHFTPLHGQSLHDAAHSSLLGHASGVSWGQGHRSMHVLSRQIFFGAVHADTEMQPAEVFAQAPVVGHFTGCCGGHVQEVTLSVHVLSQHRVSPSPHATAQPAFVVAQLPSRHATGALEGHGH